MDWEDTQEQAAFRAEVRRLIDERLPSWYRERRELGIEHGSEGGWVADRASGDAERVAEFVGDDPLEVVRWIGKVAGAQELPEPVLSHDVHLGQSNCVFRPAGYSV